MSNSRLLFLPFPLTQDCAGRCLTTNSHKINKPFIYSVLGSVVQILALGPVSSNRHLSLEDIRNWLSQLLFSFLILSISTVRSRLKKKKTQFPDYLWSIVGELSGMLRLESAEQWMSRALLGTVLDFTETETQIDEMLGLCKQKMRWSWCWQPPVQVWRPTTLHRRPGGSRKHSPCSVPSLPGACSWAELPAHWCPVASLPGAHPPGWHCLCSPEQHTDNFFPPITVTEWITPFCTRLYVIVNIKNFPRFALAVPALLIGCLLNNSLTQSN